MIKCTLCNTEVESESKNSYDDNGTHWYNGKPYCYQCVEKHFTYDDNRSEYILIKEC